MPISLTSSGQSFSVPLMEENCGQVAPAMFVDQNEPLILDVLGGGKISVTVRPAVPPDPNIAVASSQGTSTASASSASVAVAIGVSEGVSEVNATSSVAALAAAGSSAGVSITQAAGAIISAAQGASSGSATATSNSSTTPSASGSSNGTSTTIATGAAVVTADGVSDAASSVFGSGTSIVAADGSAAGSTSLTGVGSTVPVAAGFAVGTERSGTIPSVNVNEVIALPGTNTGEVVFMALSSDINPDGYTVTGNNSGAWVSLAVSGGANPTTAMFYQIAGATPDTEVTVGTVTDRGFDHAYVVQAWSGADVATPIDNSVTTYQSGGNETPSAPAHTTLTDGAMLIHIIAVDDDDVSSTSNVPAGYGEFLAAGVSNNVTVMIFSREVPTAGAQPAVTVTNSGGDVDRVFSASFALKPAP